jgi:hypothetical protein
MSQLNPVLVYIYVRVPEMFFSFQLRDIDFVCRAIAQAVSRWLPTAAARVQTRV